MLYERRILKNNLLIKKLCIYPYMFKFQSPSKYSPLDAIRLPKCFFHCWQLFLNSLILMPLNASAIFCFTSSTSSKHFPLRTFHPGIQKKSCLGKIGWIGRAGPGGHAIFSQQLLNTQHGAGRWGRKSPITKWAKVLKESSEKFTEAKQPLTTLPAGTWVPRTLT